MHRINRFYQYLKTLYPVKLLLILILLLLIGVGIVTYKVNNQAYDSANERKIAYEQLMEVSAFRTVLSLVNKDFNNFITSEDQANIKNLKGYLDELKIRLKSLSGMFRDNKDVLARVKTLETLSLRKFTMMEEMIALKANNEQDSLFNHLKSLLRYNSEIRDNVYSLEDYVHSFIDDKDQEILSKHKDTAQAIFAGTVLTCIFFTIIFYLLNKEITERKNAEDDIRKQMQFTERLINSSIDGIIAFDKDYNYTLWNPGMEALSGISSSRVIGKNIFKIFPILKEIGEDKYFHEALKGNFVIAKDRWINFSETEKEFYFEAYYSPIYDVNKEIIGGLAIIRNTTQRKLASEALEKTKAELERRVIERTQALSKVNDDLKKEISQRKLAQEQINQSLQEKVVLLQEIHHRVKNNLQVISSLLNLQSGYIEDEKSREIFRESQNRVRSMALIHERLYQSKDLNKIEFDVYINSLCKDLFSSYFIAADRISLRTELSDIYFEIDIAILCGLIINELVSNSLKHAFPGDRAGEIYVGLNEKEENNFELIVRDNGIGFPSNVNFRETESLGLQLVNTLTEQLGGEIELNNGIATEFRIVFTRKSPSLHEREVAA